MKGPVEIAPGVHGLGSEYVNWYLVEEGDRLTAVDAGLPGFAKHLDEDLRALGRHRSDVTALVLTHSDADHTGVARDLQQAGARVLVHVDDEGTLRKPRLKTGDASPRNLLPYLRHGTPWRLLVHMGRQGGARPPALEGAETYRDGDVLDVPGSPRAVHTPGHTPGHCCFYWEDEGTLFSGDLLFAGSIGRTDLPGGSFHQLVESMRDRVMTLDDDVLVLPGHGAETTIGRERTENPFRTEWA